MNECVIYDFETLGQDQLRSVVVSFAMLSFSEKRYIENPYSYEELVDSCKYIKFDVEEQTILFNRKISIDTVKWWNSQGAEAKKQIQATPKELRSLETPSTDKPAYGTKEFWKAHWEKKKAAKANV